MMDASEETSRLGFSERITIMIQSSGWTCDWVSYIRSYWFVLDGGNEARGFVHFGTNDEGCVHRGFLGLCHRDASINLLYQDHQNEHSREQVKIP